MLFIQQNFLKCPLYLNIEFLASAYESLKSDPTLYTSDNITLLADTLLQALHQNQTPMIKGLVKNSDDFRLFLDNIGNLRKFILTRSNLSQSWGGFLLSLSENADFNSLLKKGPLHSHLDTFLTELLSFMPIEKQIIVLKKFADLVPIYRTTWTIKINEHLRFYETKLDIRERFGTTYSNRFGFFSKLLGFSVTEKKAAVQAFRKAILEFKEVNDEHKKACSQGELGKIYAWYKAFLKLLPDNIKGLHPRNRPNA